MKITICGSTAFINEMAEVAKELESLGHEVKFPPLTVINEDGREWHTRDYYDLKKQMVSKKPLTSPLTPLYELERGTVQDDFFWLNHTERIKNHFNKVEWAEAILVTNYPKNDIEHYIGPNTLMEMGLAFHLDKKIFLLHPIPEVAWKEEILGMRPVAINNNLALIKV